MTIEPAQFAPSLADGARRVKELRDRAQIEVGRVVVGMERVVNRFLIALSPATGGASSITLSWGDQSWTTDITAAGK